MSACRRASLLGTWQQHPQLHPAQRTRSLRRSLWRLSPWRQLRCRLWNSAGAVTVRQLDALQSARNLTVGRQFQRLICQRVDCSTLLAEARGHPVHLQNIRLVADLGAETAGCDGPARVEIEGGLNEGGVNLT